MAGEAHLDPMEEEPSALLYRETLKFPAPNGELLAGFREYIYRFEDRQLALYFSNSGKQGGLFMRLDSDGGPDGGLRGEHHCKTDLYKGELCEIDQDRFLIRYTVTGPKKNHVLETLYSRVE